MHFTCQHSLTDQNKLLACSLGSWVPAKSQIRWLLTFFGVFYSVKEAPQFTGITWCALYLGMHKEHDTGRAQQSISEMQELIQRESASKWHKRERVSKQTWPKNHILQLIYIHKGQIWARGLELSYCCSVTEKVTNPMQLKLLFVLPEWGPVT